MPGRDGTGPMGAGAMTGRGLGVCTDSKAAKYGAGLAMGLGLGLACRRGLRRGLGRGLGRSFGINRIAQKSQKELLNEQKSILQNQLEAIDKQLEEL